MLERAGIGQEIVTDTLGEAKLAASVPLTGEFISGVDSTQAVLTSER